MDDNTISDLKQFIATTIKQEIAGLDKKIDDKTEEILSAIGDSTNDRFDTVEEDVSKLDTRVTKLESNPA